MAAQAAHVVDKVLPSVPLRQWVVSFPYELRLLLAKNPDVLSARFERIDDKGQSQQRWGARTSRASGSGSTC